MVTAVPVDGYAADVALVVERSVVRPSLGSELSEWAELGTGTVLGLGDGATLHLDPPAGSAGTVASTWRSSARIHVGRARPLAHVEVELTTWPGQTGELVLRPAAGRVGRWSRRRQERYFTLVHRAADRLAQALVLGPWPTG